MASFHQRSVNAHQFAIAPQSDVPRSRFNAETALKTTFDSGYLVPIYLDEVLPGDSFNLSLTLFGRMTTPLFPVMDNLHLETFFFFVPNRLIWDNWQKFMGERFPDPNSSVDFLIPEMTSPAGGYAPNSLSDYFGIPTGVAGLSHSALYHRAYNLIFNEWFRDQNLQSALPVPRGDGPDDPSLYQLRKRGKRHDYFTSCLPWPQKGDPVSLPIQGVGSIVGQSAYYFADPVISDLPNSNPSFGVMHRAPGGDSAEASYFAHPADLAAPEWPPETTGTFANSLSVGINASALAPFLSLDTSSVSMATINQLRTAFQLQKLLERDARGGTRYTEIIRSHFGVMSPDARLQRPEYLGGGHSFVNVNPIAQTSATADDSSPMGTLAAMGTVQGSRHGFSQAFTEHGVIIGLVMVRADLTYQQGLHRRFSRSTRNDFYFPAFAHLGEQAVLNKEIYAQGNASDDAVFGYQERWAEYRYKPSMITGQFRSNYAQTLDAWHYAQNFSALPALNSDFIEENPPLARNLAVGAAASGQQFYLDCFFNVNMSRPLPLYSVPGLIDHF